MIVGRPRVSVVEDGAGGAGGCYGGVAGVPRPAVEVRVVLERGLGLVLRHPCTVVTIAGNKPSQSRGPLLVKRVYLRYARLRI